MREETVERANSQAMDVAQQFVEQLQTDTAWQRRNADLTAQLLQSAIALRIGRFGQSQQDTIENFAGRFARERRCKHRFRRSPLQQDLAATARSADTSCPFPPRPAPASVEVREPESLRHPAATTQTDCSSPSRTVRQVCPVGSKIASCILLVEKRLGLIQQPARHTGLQDHPVVIELNAIGGRLENRLPEFGECNRESTPRLAAFALH